MSVTVPISKNEHGQEAIPSVWRETISEIVRAFAKEDYGLVNSVVSVRPISATRAKAIAANITEYGGTVVALPDDAWRTSVCQWMRGYWDALIDLFTLEEGASDLVLALRVYEQGTGYVFEVQSVHVP